VLTAKRRFLAKAPMPYGAPWFDPAHDALEREIAHRIITVARNSGAVPLRLSPNEALVVVSAHRCLDDLAEALRLRHPRVVTYALSGSFDSMDAVEAVMAAEEDYGEIGAVIVATAPHEPWTDRPIDQERQAAVIHFLADLDARHPEIPELIVIALREPYDIRRFPEVRNYVCTYGHTAASLDAVAAALFGEYEPTGRLPVTLPD
jgi:beta-N-acetylhexosaminidase